MYSGKCAGLIGRDGHERVCEACGLVVDSGRLGLSVPPSKRFDSQQVLGTRAPATVRLSDKGLVGGSAGTFRHRA